MAGLYDFGRNEFALGNIDWVADTIRAFLIDEADYTENLATDQDLADVPAAARIGNAGASTRTDGASLGTKATPDTDGACDAADTTLTAVPSAEDVAEELILYRDDGAAEATSTLIAHWQSGDVTGLPITFNDADVIIQWQATTPYIFKL